MKIAYLFSGQGAQYPGMMLELYNNYPAAARMFHQADQVLERSVSALCFEGTQEELNMTHNTQPCLLTAELAAHAVLAEFGVKPSAVAGFSLGEYAALTVAGVMTPADALRTVQLRADAMQAAVPVGQGAMAAIMGVAAEEVEAMCATVADGYVIAANYNSPTQTVVSGDVAGVDAVLALAEQKSVRAMRLNVSAPFHSALMEPAARKLEQAFPGIPFSEPTVAAYMNVNAEPLANAAATAGLLVRQAMSPVRWQQTLQNMWRDGIDTFVEIGPGSTLSSFVKKTLKEAAVCRVENQKTLEEALSMLGVQV